MHNFFLFIFFFFLAYIGVLPTGLRSHHLSFAFSSSLAYAECASGHMLDHVHSATRKDQVNKRQELLNSIDPHIKFTTELPEETVYRNTARTDVYLNLQL